MRACYKGCLWTQHGYSTHALRGCGHPQETPKGSKRGNISSRQERVHDASPLTEDSMAVAAEGCGGHISLGEGKPPVVFSCSCGWTLSRTSS